MSVIVNSNIMKKLNSNILIDVLMLAAMATVSGSGFLLEEVCRRGVTFLGLGRRMWADIHLWSGIVLVVLLALHIILHWSTINAFFKKTIPSCTVRYIVYIILLALVLITIAPWFFIF